jgi:hypothetical protein
MSQNTARHDPRATSEEEDVATTPQPRRPEHKQRVPRRPVGQPAGDGGVGPDEPDEGEFPLIGDNDLGAADLGPADPNATDPDARSGRIRKM